MVELSNNKEVTLVGVGAACGAAAVYLSQQPIPIEIKTTLVTVLGLVSTAIGAFWAAKVKPKTEGT